MPGLVALWDGSAEYLQGLVLGCGGEGKVAGVGQQLLALHNLVDLVLGGLVLVFCASLSQCHGHRRRRPPTLAGMGLIDDDGELAAPVLVADGVQDEGKLLDSGDGYSLAPLKERSEVAGGLGMAHDGADLGELLDRVPYLLVQHPPVRDDDHGVEDGRIVLLQSYQLVGEPRDGVGLAAARRVLDQILGTDSPTGCVGQQSAHHVQLVIAGPYLLSPLSARLVVPAFHDLGVVLDDVGQAVAGDDMLPEIIGLEAVGVGRVARAVVPPLVEGQEP